jgi:dTMP kinase
VIGDAAMAQPAPADAAAEPVRTGPPRGRFITFEGIDGAGKSTQILALADLLRARGVHVLVTREPGGTPLGERLRDVFLGQAMTPLTELLLVFAARAEHVARVIAPALAEGRWVVCDRFSDATYAYQCGGRGVPAAWFTWLEATVHGHVTPDLTLLFDLPPDIAAQRLRHGRAGEGDRLEEEGGGFFARVRAAYLERAAAAPGRFRVLDATRPVDALRAAVTDAVAAWT